MVLRKASESPELRFDGRVAIVTGAGRGIGRAHALLLASRGAAVVVNDVGWDVDGRGPSSAPADEVVTEIRGAGGVAVANYASVADEDAPSSIVQKALDEFGRIDIVINNAGTVRAALFLEHTIDDFRQMFEIHVIGSIGIARAAWPHFQAQSFGRILNTVSPSMTGMAGFTAYTAMKGALVSFTKTLALEGLEYGIRVNALAPSAFTRNALSMPEQFFSRERVEESRQERDPRLVAPVAAFLTHESCELNGEIVFAGGGTVTPYLFELGSRLHQA